MTACGHGIAYNIIGNTRGEHTGTYIHKNGIQIHTYTHKKGIQVHTYTHKKVYRYICTHTRRVYRYIHMYTHKKGIHSIYVHPLQHMPSYP